MTAETTTPRKGKERIGRWQRGDDSSPFEDVSNEELAVILVDWREELDEAVEEVRRALVDESEPLTDEALKRMTDAMVALRAVDASLTYRVPDAHRAENEAR
jgi:hypothetical protein